MRIASRDHPRWLADKGTPGICTSKRIPPTCESLCRNVVLPRLVTCLHEWLLRYAEALRTWYQYSVEPHQPPVVDLPFLVMHAAGRPLLTTPRLTLTLTPQNIMPVVLTHNGWLINGNNLVANGMSRRDVYKKMVTAFVDSLRFNSDEETQVKVTTTCKVDDLDVFESEDMREQWQGVLSETVAAAQLSDCVSTSSLNARTICKQ